MWGHTNPEIRTTEAGEIVGPKMHRCVRIVASGPSRSEKEAYPSMNRVAKIIGPNGSQQYGYKIVNRCISKGLISSPDPDHPDANPHGRGAVTVTDKGERYLETHE